MRTTAALLFFIVFFGCAAQERTYVRDGKAYGVTSGLFRDRFWNYYERGMSFAEGGFYDEAVSDFQTAIQKRSSDQWRGRTYGMHFIDYFPHRELGIVYYKIGKHTDAERELLRSLESAESAKAKYYLNEVHRAILEKTGADRSLPELTLTSPADGLITNRFSLDLRGVAEDDHYVSSVLVNGVTLPFELARKTLPFEEEIALERGINKIMVRAIDLTGKEVEKTVMVNVDRDGPVIGISDYRVADSKVMLSGFISDMTGIAEFTLNDRKIPVSQSAASGSGEELEFHEEIEVSESSRTVNLKVMDNAGNVTRGELDMILDRSDGQKAGQQPARDGNPLLAASFTAETEYAFMGSGLGKILDSVPPTIHFRGLADFQTVYDDALFIEGSVSDDSKVVSLLINGISILKRSGKRVFFNYLTKLKEGGNRFYIEASDSMGNTIEKIIAVDRKVPRIRQIGSRMSISILPLERKGEHSISGDAIHDSLLAAFVNQKRFHVVERERLEEVLRELKLSQSKLVDQKSAAEVGKILVADAVLTGTVYETENSIEVLSRLVNTETSEVIEVKDVFDEGKSLRSVNRLMEGLALKYKKSFPLLEGYVIKKEGASVIIDLGQDRAMRKDMGVILFREGEEVRHPVTGRTIGTEPIELGEAKIQDVYIEFSKAKITRGRPEGIRIKDKIITK